MARTSKPIRYGKPCMTNLPPELGREIFRQILASEPLDRRKMEPYCRQVLARIERRMEQLKCEAADHAFGA